MKSRRIDSFIKKSIVMIVSSALLIGSINVNVYADDWDGDGVDDGAFMGSLDGMSFIDPPVIDPPVPDPTPEPIPEPVKLPTPAIVVSILHGYIDNVYDGAYISYDGGASWSGPVYGGGCMIPGDILPYLAPGSVICAKMIGDGLTTLDSDVQYVTLTQEYFPIPPPDPTPIPTPDPTPDPTPIPTPDPTPIPTPDPTPIPTPIIEPVKLPTPNATFDATTGILGEIPNPGAISLDIGNTWMNCSGYIPLDYVDPDMEIMVKALGDYVYTIDSDIEIIWISKAATPIGIATTSASTTDNNGTIINVNADMEYRPSGNADWIHIYGTSVTGLAPGSYDVRVAAFGSMLASDYVTVVIDRNAAIKQPTPNAIFDGISMRINNLGVGMAVSYDGGFVWDVIHDQSCTYATIDRNTANVAIMAGGIKVKRLGDGISTLDSDIQTVAIGKATTPAGITTVSTAEGKNNGSIGGLSNDLQYCVSGTGSWIDIGSSSVTNLAAGNYDVRRRASGALIASDICTVNIAVNRKGKADMPSATFNAMNMTLSNVRGCKYTTNDRDYSKTVTDKDDVILDPSTLRADKGIKIIRTGDNNTADSDVQYIELKWQSAPSGIGAQSATIKVGGKITGTSNVMEYKSENGYWTNINGTSVNNLPAGTYYVRNRGYYNTLPSDSIKVIIQKKAEEVVVTDNTKKDAVATPTPTPTLAPTKAPQSNTGDKKNDSQATADTSKKQPEEAVQAEPAEETTPAEDSKPAATSGDADREALIEQEAHTDATGVPMLLGSPEIEGWGAIEAQMDQDTVEITMNGNNYLPAEVLSGARSTNTEIILDMSEDVSWEISPSSIQTISTDVNMGMKQNVQTIPADVLAKAKGDGVVAKQFDLNHNGDFGFKAKLIMLIDPAMAGQYANLMYYNPNVVDMELISTSVIDEDGRARFDMTHASSYAVVVTSKEMTAADASLSVEAPDVKTQGQSSTFLWIILAVIAAAAIGIAVVVVGNNRKKIRRK